MNALSMRWMMAGAVLLAGCSSVPVNAPRNGDAGSVSFPDPSASTMPEGDFVNLQNLRQIAPGLSKEQVRRLLGAPHFNEGVFGVRRWNYLFDFHESEGDHRAFRCQYQVQFDDHDRSSGAYWKPASCDRVLAVPTSMAPAVAEMPVEPLRLSSDTLFKFNRADLTLAGQQQLAGVLQQIRGASEVQNILIVGYTDRIGRSSYNLELSRRRATAVQRFLVAGGVAESAIKVEARGEQNPLVQCTQRKRAELIVCLAPNRRVELSGSARP